MTAPPGPVEPERALAVGHAVRVLVVDDNALNLTLAEAVLEADGMEVRCAADADGVWACLAAWAPDVILMDIQLPGVDGLTLARQIKARPAFRRVPVLAFTAFAMRGDQARFQAAGCDGYIAKPIEVLQLARQVRACLRPAPGQGGASPGPPQPPLTPS